ncbi:MAG: MATE family efflux transporter [Lentisphaerae bacterium]|nr:MATE family efflux transporter [Lentisphaerota bacterium]
MGIKKKYQVDMCHGPLTGKIVRFAVPLMLTNALNLMFHAADLIVIGKFAPGEAMAAVGSAPAFTMLMLNLFFGVSSAVNVLVARYTGAQDKKNLFHTLHTAMAIACAGGTAMTVIGLLITTPVLKLMSVPDAILGKASLYLWIWCLGIPFMILYSFGSAILRSVGDTKRPLIYMASAGVVNVLLNLFFVLVCKMDVAGVAIATKLSNVLSAVLVLRALKSCSPEYQIKWSKLHFHLPVLKELLRIGIPAGIQGMLFSFSNVIIQSTINSFGWQAIAGSTAALSIEGMIHTTFTAYALAVISFVGQNHGARKYKRIMKSIYICMAGAVFMALSLTGICHIFKVPLLMIYNSDMQVIDWGLIRINYQLTFYFLLAVMEIINGALRGLGYSFVPTIVTLMGACVFRVGWVFLIFPLNPCMESLMISYPASWVLVSLVNGGMLFVICRRMLIKASRRQFDDLTVKK